MKLIILFTLIGAVYCVHISVNKEEEAALLDNTYNRLGAPKGTDLYELDDKIMAIYRNPLPERGKKMLFYLRTVSYTHLDVYKRQIVMRSISVNLADVFIKDF